MNHRPILLAVLLTLTACSSDNPKTAPSTTTSPATAESTKTTSAPSTTTTSTTTVDASTSTSATATTEPVTTDPSTTIAGEVNWLTVLQTLGQRRQDLYAAPEVSRIPEVCGDQSQCADQLNVQLGDLAKKGWRVAGADRYVVLDARVEKFDGGTLDTSLLVTVVVVIRRPANAGTIVDSSGSLIADVQAQTTPGHNARGRFLLARVGPADDPWRLVSQDTLPEVPA